MSWLYAIAIFAFILLLIPRLTVRPLPFLNPLAPFAKSSLQLLGGAAFLVAVSVSLFQKTFFFAEPGYIYHVRTIFGQERVVDELGYSAYLFGSYNAWKRAMTVQATTDAGSPALQSELDSDSTSAVFPPLNIMFLDQVDANVSATVRFSIPSDNETFLRLVHLYRNPDNLLRTELIPAFKETLQATGALMSAEDYYSGGRTEFNSEFQNQMERGIYIVKRIESRRKTAKTSGTANVALGTEQAPYGEEEQTVFEVKKVLDDKGLPVRKEQGFTRYGIAVIDARVTDMRPNDKFVERMQLKQKASADRAIAREQRIQEEEQRLLAITRGEREVAERQAQAKVEQIQKTTEAETTKQLAITEANKFFEQAKISKDTAQINLEKARIEAETKKTLADAEAYQRKAVLQADNALAQKLDAEVSIHKLWADAYAKRHVPANVFGSGAGGAPVGSDSEAKDFMRILTLDAAQRLNYQRNLSNSPEAAASKDK